MISASDRHRAVELIAVAHQAGARRHQACQQLGLTLRTVQRWTTGERMRPDGRPLARRPTPRNRLSPEERALVWAVCHEPAHASLPPSQLVPRLADQGQYLASESTFYRVLRAADAQHHRGRSRPPQRTRLPVTHAAHQPGQVWSWDITWLPGPAKGLFFYLYLILDLYSRKIVGWELFEQESGEHAATVVQRAVVADGRLLQPLVLHADNGSPMKGATLRTTLERLGIVTSYSRPRVSNDNPFSEALFRTCKYRPTYPAQGFAPLEAARTWVLAFVRWYTDEHRHSGLRFVTPSARHAGHDRAILQQRQALYEQARGQHPARWSRQTRNWTPVGTVWLNPETRAMAETRHAECGA
jgi:putative transposase